LNDARKQKRNLRKKLRQIDALEERRREGAALSEQEMAKLLKKHDFRRALAKLDREFPSA